MKKEATTNSGPWWKFGHMWLVIGGPAVVVVAALATAVIAVRYADPVVETDYYRRGMEINKTLAAHERAKLPAMQGRNHAATPADDATP